MSNKNKILVGMITASLSFFGAVKVNEGFSSKPIVPTRGDVPTIGHGTTIYPNGVSVTLYDRPITPSVADQYLHHDVSKKEAELKRSIPNVKLSQQEYEVYLDFIYQYGIGTFNRSTTRMLLINGEHISACQSLLRYRFVAKRDCKIRSHQCYGVYQRQLKRVQKCMEANQ